MNKSQIRLPIDCQFKDKRWDGFNFFTPASPFASQLHPIIPRSIAVTEVSVSPKPPLDYKTLWGHGECLLCCHLSHPTYTALTIHLNQWLLDWMRVPPDNKVHDFSTVLSWARRRSHFPCLILFAPRAWESGFVFKIRWTSSSPLPLNEGSAEAKGSVLWNGYCSVARDCWATSHAFGFIIRGLYTGAGSLPVFFS